MTNFSFLYGSHKKGFTYILQKQLRLCIDKNGMYPKVQDSQTLKVIGNNRKYVVASLTFLGAFLCVLLLRNHLLTFDLTVSGWMPTIQSSWVTSIAIVISYAFDTYSLFVASLAIAGYLFYKNYRSQSLLLLVAMGGNAVFVALFKTLVHAERPLEGLIADSGYSFPSGHTAGSLVFCGLLAYFAYRHWKTTRPHITQLTTTLASLIVLVVGFDRLYLNVHWFSDVLGGCLLGLFWLTFSILLFHILIASKRNHRK
jgi:undecaprenyl-diphosphatase